MNLEKIQFLLSCLHGPEIAGKWLNLPNTNELFKGDTPMQFIKKNGDDGIRKIEELLLGRTQ